MARGCGAGLTRRREGEGGSGGNSPQEGECAMVQMPQILFLLWAGGRLSTGSGRRKQRTERAVECLGQWQQGAERRPEQEVGAVLMGKMPDGGFGTSFVDSQDQGEERGLSQCAG